MIIKRQYSIRDRLLYSFLMTAALMCIVVLYSFISTNSVAVSITNAYRTNVELNEFQTVLDRVESSMERYIGLRTFESIEDYFSWRGKLDSMALRFTTSLSDNPVLLQEYKTKKLMESFLEYAEQGCLRSPREQCVRILGQLWKRTPRIRILDRIGTQSECDVF